MYKKYLRLVILGLALFTKNLQAGGSYEVHPDTCKKHTSTKRPKRNVVNYVLFATTSVAISFVTIHLVLKKEKYQTEPPSTSGQETLGEETWRYTPFEQVNRDQQTQQNTKSLQRNLESETLRKNSSSLGNSVQKTPEYTAFEQLNSPHKPPENALHSNEADSNEADSNEAVSNDNQVQSKSSSPEEISTSEYLIVDSPLSITLQSILDGTSKVKEEFLAWKNKAKRLYAWLSGEVVDDSKGVKWVAEQVLWGCLFYSRFTSQDFQEGTFCLMTDKNQSLTQYIYAQGANRISSHLKNLSKSSHRGVDLDTPIDVNGQEKRTILFIDYQAINSKKMLLVKPENSAVVSARHFYEYLLPPKGIDLVDRKERLIEIIDKEMIKRFKQYKNFDEIEYKKYGISYLHKHKYFFREEDIVSEEGFEGDFSNPDVKTIKDYLKRRKLDFLEVRIGEEVIIDAARLKNVLEEVEEKYNLLNALREKENEDFEIV